MLDIDESYFEAETRDGFLVPAMMKRAFAAQMEICEEIRKICERHDIQYFAVLGTLLGMVRHEGRFIPWDDDIDLGMKRADVKKFLQYAHDELPEGFMLLHNKYNENYRDIMARIVNSNSIDWSDDFLRRFHGCPFSCGVDIFTIDKLPRTKGQIDMIKGTFVAVDETLKLMWQTDFDKEKQQAVRAIEKACHVKFDHSKPIDRQLIAYADDKVCGMFEDLPEDQYDQVVMIPAIARSPYYNGVSKEAYSDVQWESFEGIIKLPVPVGYDEILSQHYGADYMTPKMNTSSHDYPFYRGQQRDIKAFLEQRPEYAVVLEKYLQD